MQITESELWAAVDAAVGAAEAQREAGSITVAEYCARHGIGRRAASERLSRALSAGKLTAKTVIIDGHVCKCYSPCTPMNVPKSLKKRQA